MSTLPAWALPVEDVLQHHGVDASKGLSSKDVEARRQQYGYNELRKEPGTPLWKLILEQFNDTLVKVDRGCIRRAESHEAQHHQTGLGSRCCCCCWWRTWLSLPVRKFEHPTAS